MLKLSRYILPLIAVILSVSPLSDAFAQTAPPPVRQFIDANGVDLFLGTYNVSATDVSLGNTSSAQGLALTRYWQGNLLRYNAMASMTLNGTTMMVSIANVSDSFSVSGTTYTPLLGNGSSLTQSGGVFTYVAHDGSVVTFSQNLANVVMLTGEQARATDIVRPNGEHLVLSYNMAQICNQNSLSGGQLMCTQPTSLSRLSTVTNSSGYELYFGYALQASGLAQSPNIPSSGQIATYLQVVAITGINLAVENCTPSDPVNTSGNCTHTWPQTVYTQSGSTYTVTDPLSHATTYTLGGSGLTNVQLPSTNSVSIGYNASGQVSAVTTASGTTSYSYSISGSTQTTIVTDALTHSTTYTFDIPSQTLRSVKDPLSYTTSYQVDGYGRVTQVTAPEGNYTQYQYDARGNVTQTTNVAKSGSGLSNISTSAGYDASCANAAKCNQPNWTKDALQNETDYTYDTTTGLLTSVTAPAKPNGVRPQTRYSYTASQAYYYAVPGTLSASGQSINLLTSTSTCQIGASGALSGSAGVGPFTLSSAAACAGTADEIKTTITYGTTGVANNLLPTASTVAAGDNSLSETTQTGYDMIGNPTSQTDPLGNSTLTLYDAARQVTQTVSPDPDGAGPLLNRSTQILYTKDGLPRRFTLGSSNADGSGFSALAAVATIYDGNNRKITQSTSVTGAPVSVNQYSYDAAGRPSCTVQRMNPAAYGSLPSSACTLGTAGSFGNDRITQNTYDAAGHVLNIVTGLGDTDPTTGTQRTYVTYTYNANGTVFNLADGNGNLTSYTYDGFDRLSETHYAVPSNGTQRSPTDYDAYNYDANGNVTSRKLRDGNAISYSYDALNRLYTKTLPSPEAGVTYSYTNQGSALVINQGSVQLTNAYDGLGRLISEGQAFGAMAYQYDLDNRTTRVTWGDGLYVQYDHLNTGEVSAIRENGATSGVGVLANYSYDNWGRLTNIARGNGVSSTIGFNATDATLNTLNHSIASAPVTYTFNNYNPAGQIGSRSRDNDAYAFPGYTNVNRNYLPNGLNQYASAGPPTGTQTSFTYDQRGNLSMWGSGTSATNYGYSSENFMTSALNGTSLYYDPAGRLVEYDTNVSTRFVYTGSQMASELRNTGSSNTLLRRYVWGPGSDVPVVQYEGADTSNRLWLHTDEHGSVVAITNAAGALIATNSYDDYGIPASSNAGLSSGGRFQYTGQAWLSEIGLFYYKARMYSPTLGRFMQTDPIGYGDGPNWYNYVGSDPVNYFDPSGLETCIVRTLVQGYSFTLSDGTTGVVATKQVRSCQPGGDGVGGSPSSGSGGGWKGPTPPKRQIKTLPRCAVDFLSGIYDPRLHASISNYLNNVTLHDGGSILNFDYNRNSVTFYQDVYLHPAIYSGTDYNSYFIKFHEINHTIQFAIGASLTQFAYQYASTFSHDSAPLEIDSDTAASIIIALYYAKGLNKTCPF